MIFLKKFKAIGFKSFANPINLTFSESMIGIVGPNGTGKSNIVDAIKWVLGEQSKKALRGKAFTDIIFHGSRDKEGNDYALVSLTFDNNNKILHSDANEIVVTRKVTRENANNEYFINNKPCRLKDIQELFLDTGLTKGSLGIISQGTVQWFVEAKPDDRRKIFEDAAGIGLYAKKKMDSLAELEKATINLNRIDDYVHILQTDIKKLTKQVEKAQIYHEKKKQLTELELIILVKDITYYKAQSIELKQIIDKNKQIIIANELEIDALTKQLVVVKERANQSDKEVEEDNKKFTDLIQQINKLEIKKNSQQNKLNLDLSSNSIDKQIIAYKQLITNLEYDLKIAYENKEKLTNEINSYEEIRNTQQVKYDNLVADSSNFMNKISSLYYQIKSIDEKIENEFANNFGTKAIVENKKGLKGIVGVVKDFIQVDRQYETAITIALGRSTNFIITETENDSKNAIDFLKINKAGKATFLPLTLVKPRPIRDEFITIAQQIDGYIDVASNLISFDAKYSDLFSMLLGRIFITEDLVSAISLSKFTKSNYQIVTLDGQTISVGGAITGGYNKVKIVSIFNLEDNKKQLINKLDELNKQHAEIKIKQTETKANLDETINKINEKKILLGNYDNKIKNYESNLYRYKIDYEQISKDNKVNITKELTISDINKELADLQVKKDKIIQDLNVARTIKLNNRQIADDYQLRLNETHILVNRAKTEQANAEINLEKANAIINNAKEKINLEYHMTVDNAIANWTKELPMSIAQAKEIIYQLKVDLDQIGNINMEALKELEEKQKEFKKISVQHKQLFDAKQAIEKAIIELDNNARNNFKQTIDRVNKVLPNVFGYLFGGGSAFITYVNPDDILNSGIDVTANPPGKKITTLNLLSGGEKSLVALSVLFSILKIHNFPLIILDEAESALDPANVERFGKIIKDNSKNTQFLIITHRPGTMERCDSLFGTTMQIKGITNMYKVSLTHAKNEYGSNSQ